MFDKIFKTPIGIAFISIIWGLGLSTIFRYSCEGSKCKVIVYKGPPVKEIDETVFNYGTNECYKYSPIIINCPE